MFEEAISELRSGEKKLRNLYRNPSVNSEASKPLAWFVKGRRNTVRTLQSIIEEASSEILLEEPLSLLNSTLGRLHAKFKRGVDVYLLLYGGELTEALKRKLADSGVGEVRLAGLGHYLLCVADQATCLYAPRKLFSGSVVDANQSNTLVFREKEIAQFFNHNFFVAWFKARELISQMGEYTNRVYTNQRVALYVLSKLLARGVNPKVRVQGRNTKTGKPVRLDGRVLDVRIEDEVYSFTLDSEGTLLEVGGDNALVETVMAEKVEILEGGQKRM
ncbi:MAG: TrmB family transcriptional regulator sugar-binding domain-containing protein [Thermoprotei archaeon]